MNFCGSCGAGLAPGARFCGTCGGPVTVTDPGSVRTNPPAPLLRPPGTISYPSPPVSPGQLEYPGQPQYAAPPHYPGPPLDAGPPAPTVQAGRRQWLIIGIVVALVLAGAGIGAWFWLRPSTDATTATEVDNYPTVPTAGMSIDLADIFTDASLSATDGRYATTILNVDDSRVVIKSAALVKNTTTYEYELVVAGIDRSTGKVAWVVRGDTLDPSGKGSADDFSCQVAPTSKKIICVTGEYNQSTQKAFTDFTVIDPSTGATTSSQAEGYYRYSLSLVGDDALLTISGKDSKFDLIRVDPVTGTQKWATTVSAVGSEFYGGQARGGFVTTGESTSTSGTTSTLLLNPDTGEREHEIPGYVYGDGAWYSFADRTGSTGVQRVDNDGKVLWSDGKLNMLPTQYSPTQPVLTSQNGTKLVALDPADGHQLWQSDRNITGSMSGFFADRLIFEDANRSLIFDSGTGAFVASAADMFIGGGDSLFYTASDTQLSAYDTKTGARTWTSRLNQIDSSVDDTTVRVQAAGGLLFLTDRNTVRLLVSQ